MKIITALLFSFLLLVQAVGATDCETLCRQVIEKDSYSSLSSDQLYHVMQVISDPATALGKVWKQDPTLHECRGNCLTMLGKMAYQKLQVGGPGQAPAQPRQQTQSPSSMGVFKNTLRALAAANSPRVATQYQYERELNELNESVTYYNQEYNRISQWANSWIARAMDWKRRDDAFRYTLSNKQIELFNNLKKYDNKESYDAFIKTLPPAKQNEIIDLKNTLFTLADEQTRLLNSLRALQNQKTEIDAAQANIEARYHANLQQIDANRNSSQLQQSLRDIADHLGGIERKLRWGY